MGAIRWISVTATGATPERTLLFLHGILGSGINFRGFARRLVDAHPDWAAVLVDLRMHGDSQGLRAPHDIAQAAADLDGLDPQMPAPIRGVLGHSFGGKVALAYLDRHRDTLSHAFILDSDPGARPYGAGSDFSANVVRLLERLPPLWTRRDDFIGRMVDEGISRSISQWLAMNLVPAPGGFRFKLELSAIRALLEDYFIQDLWRVLEPPPANVRIRFVLGGQSPVCGPAMLERLARASQSGTLDSVTLPAAGHWVHVDDPEGTYQAVHALLGPQHATP